MYCSIIIISLLLQCAGSVMCTVCCTVQYDSITYYSVHVLYAVLLLGSHHRGYADYHYYTSTVPSYSYTPTVVLYCNNL